MSIQIRTAALFARVTTSLTDIPWLPLADDAFQTQSARRILVLNLLMMVMYYIAARLGLQLQFENSQATPIWAPSGIALGMIFVFGYRLLPGVFVGALLANLADFYFKGNTGLLAMLSEHPSTLGASLLIGAGNTGESWLAAILMRYFFSARYVSDNVKNVLYFVLACLVAPMVSATVGVTTLVMLDFLPFSLYQTVWSTWWVGDVVGALILAPLLVWITFAEPGTWRSLLKKDVILVLTLVVGITAMCFLGWGEVVFFTSEAYLLLPLLMLVMLKFGRTLTLISVFIVSALAVAGTINDIGPFVRADQNTALILLQGFIGVAIISLLLLDAMHHERENAFAQLRQLNAVLEQRVMERTLQLEHSNRDLERSNKELDDFAYIASHDLKEPLRGIENQLSFLMEDYGDQLSNEVRERLGKVPPNIRRLENLINTLLHFSRVGRLDLAMGKVNLEKMLNEILATLEGRLQQERIDIRRPASLPTVYADHARVGELFRNLITNAFKYNDKPQRWIEIGCTETAQEGQVFYVRDNGIGIPAKHFDRIFQIFKRLHGQEKYGGGTGAGMTICKKIVEKHGGRIWLASTVGEGSTFYFTLHKTEAAHTDD